MTDLLHFVHDKTRPRKRKATLPETPNPLTAETLTKAERGEELLAAENAEDLFKKLGI
ncbi:hypothetical protein [Cardiobacterium sp. Marseille-Q4385]|uniref:hypothetical protein n=1 Tax=Cardiobacterium sp. Marseille-Q4385 TaxID=2866573 RepID=UPI001CE4855E|nr:hypothetical protein [Cardiobacterium sp. Marseille-Q4385]